MSSRDEYSPYTAGREYAQTHDEPLCHGALKDKNYGPLDVLRWMNGYRDGRWEQGWTDLIDWRGGPCACGRGCR